MWISKQANGKVLQRMRGRLKTAPSTGQASTLPHLTPSPVNQNKSPAASIGSPAERRHLSIMFCDLVGSTQMSSQLDPEDLRVLMASYYEAATQALVRFDGHVAQYLGDGLLVYFGYPEAHEDDPQRAVLAGFAILDAVAALNPRTPDERRPQLAARIGIDTGSVVVGESLDKGADVFGRWLISQRGYKRWPNPAPS